MTTKTKTKKTTKKAPAKKTAKPAPKKKSLITRILDSTVNAGGDATGGAARPDGLRTGSKQAIMLDLALASGGATEEAICKELGWKKCRVTLKRVADKVGAVLTQTKNAEGKTVWSAAYPAAKKAA